MARRNLTKGEFKARAVPRFTNYPVDRPDELMAFLMRAVSGISRTRAKSLLSNRVVLVDGTIQTQYNFPLSAGMVVQISKEKNQLEFRHPQMKILYEDSYLIVIEKKQGLLSVATDRQKEKTAQHILNEYVKRKHRNNRVYVVHRLDRGTSGIMMYAKDEKTQRTLRDHWHEIVYDRRYVAVVAGEVERPGGTIQSWLTDHGLYVSSSDTDDGGKYAETHFTTIKKRNGVSLMEFQLETGRKNQIRVHMQSLGHPILGDDRYGNGQNAFERLALHAFKLAFYHPVTGERMVYETPYPSNFKALLIKKEK